MRLACHECQHVPELMSVCITTVATHVFDVGAGVDSDNIAVLDAQVVADNSVDAGTSIIKVIVREDDQNGVLPLLALNQHGVATEELQRLHGVV